MGQQVQGPRSDDGVGAKVNFQVFIHPWQLFFCSSIKFNQFSLDFNLHAIALLQIKQQPGVSADKQMEITAGHPKQSLTWQFSVKFRDLSQPSVCLL